MPFGSLSKFETPWGLRNIKKLAGAFRKHMILDGVLCHFSYFSLRTIISSAAYYEILFYLFPSILFLFHFHIDESVTLSVMCFLLHAH